MANEHIREATKKTRLIDVNDALERLRKVEPKVHVVDCLGIKAVGIDAFIRFLESRKTVDAVEVVHGRWIFKSLDQIAPCCSNCEMQSIMLYPNRPYCRAKMVNGKVYANE